MGEWNGVDEFCFARLACGVALGGPFQRRFVVLFVAFHQFLQFRLALDRMRNKSAVENNGGEAMNRRKSFAIVGRLYSLMD